MTPLPTTGPLGRRDDYEVTNRDLYKNALQQNIAINAINTELQGVTKTVADHSKMIDLLTTIKTTAIWLLTFMGIGGAASVLNWIKLWWVH